MAKSSYGEYLSAVAFVAALSSCSGPDRTFADGVAGARGGGDETGGQWTDSGSGGTSNPLGSGGTDTGGASNGGHNDSSGGSTSDTGGGRSTAGRGDPGGIGGVPDGGSGPDTGGTEPLGGNGNVAGEGGTQDMGGASGVGEPDGGSHPGGGATGGSPGGASSTGGNAAGGQGGDETGGNAAGGQATGGNATGGDETGGQGTGGNATGGQATGGEGTGGSATGGDETGGQGTGGAVEPVCPSQTIAGSPASGSGTTLGGQNNFTLSCGSGNSPDITFEWVAPDTAYYVFSTEGSAFDTVVAVLDGSCSGTELACNNDTNGPESRVVASVTAGQNYIVVVDGQAGDAGAVALSISRVTCPTQDISDVSMPVALSTGSTDQYSGACGGAGYPDRAVRYTAPSAGVYKFSVTSPDFGPALYVDRGPECGGPNLQCSFNVLNGHAAEVTRYLDGGESVTVTVDGTDGSGGAFTLDIQPVAASCPSEPEVQGTVTDVTPSSSLLSGSCGWAGNAFWTYPDVSFPVHVNLSGAGSCNVTIDRLTQDNGMFVVALIQGSVCDGEELLCEELDGSATSYTVSFSTIGTYRNGDYVLMVQNASTMMQTQTFEITSDCY